MELLTAAPALAQLEVLPGICPVRHRLDDGMLVHPRLFQLADALPVGGVRGAFHEQERLFLQRPHHIVCHGAVLRHFLVAHIGVVPFRIVVPGDHVQRIPEGEIVQFIGVHGHHVGGDRNVRVHRLYRSDLRFHKVHGLVGDEPPPVQIQPVNGSLTHRAGAVYL